MNFKFTPICIWKLYSSHLSAIYILFTCLIISNSSPFCRRNDKQTNGYIFLKKKVNKYSNFNNLKNYPSIFTMNFLKTKAINYHNIQLNSILKWITDLFHLYRIITISENHRKKLLSYISNNLFFSIKQMPSSYLMACFISSFLENFFLKKIE